MGEGEYRLVFVQLYVGEVAAVLLIDLENSRNDVVSRSDSWLERSSCTSCPVLWC